MQSELVTRFSGNERLTKTILTTRSSVDYLNYQDEAKKQLKEQLIGLLFSTKIYYIQNPMEQSVLDAT